MKRLAVCILFCLAGCSTTSSYLYVQQETVDICYLASYKVDTPDPQLENPPEGQNLLIAWSFPKSVFDQTLTIELNMRLWSNKEQIYQIAVDRKRDVTALFFPQSDPILTYQIHVLNGAGKVVETWDHQFWTPLIETNSTVSSQPKHGSVIETP